MKKEKGREGDEEAVARKRVGRTDGEDEGDDAAADPAHHPPAPGGAAPPSGAAAAAAGPDERRQRHVAGAPLRLLVLLLERGRRIHDALQEQLLKPA